MKKYRVTLTADERQRLQAMIAAGNAAAQALAHARILLKADQADGGPAWPDRRIAEALEVSVATIERVRQRLVEPGLDAALRRKEQDRPSPWACGGDRTGSAMRGWTRDQSPNPVDYRLSWSLGPHRPSLGGYPKPRIRRY
ncbi:MAG: hypothetical protein JWN86_3039 [Planctomycetota bacterium]|nr:hypothetical protein [Planctomycetota bacterium]